MKNHLRNQTSPYLLQHADNPVDWYPWGTEAFDKAQSEDKPIFLSIGYSTCHWCHVMARESFEDEHIADFLNEHFVAIKVDREERPDIDSVYMAAAQAFSGRGGWPLSIFAMPNGKPFFAGTYFPKTSSKGMIGFSELLRIVLEKWQGNRTELLGVSEEVLHILQPVKQSDGSPDEGLIALAVDYYRYDFDSVHGGFGRAPKFPAAHNLLFLLQYYEDCGDTGVLAMVEHTLDAMYRGGIFDHIGCGFSRYSTDQIFLVPHFEKMLYDNALLIMAYCKAYSITGKQLYLEVAEKTASYIFREMTSAEGGFYSAQDADSEGVEGKYYVFTPDEIVEVLGNEAGEQFNEYYDITKAGNFEGKNIPNLIHRKDAPEGIDDLRGRIFQYRLSRLSLFLDDKILLSWNGLMIAALVSLYRATQDNQYLTAAEKAQQFIELKMSRGSGYAVSYRAGKVSGEAFLDDYANYCYALLSLYGATLEATYLEKAIAVCEKTVSDFLDEEGGFFLNEKSHDQLFMRPKEYFDGAIPSGNSMMAYNLVRLYHITEDQRFDELAKQHLTLLSGVAQRHPAGFSFFLSALLSYHNKPVSVVAVLKDGLPTRAELASTVDPETTVRVYDTPVEGYDLINNQSTFYVCKDRTCLPPTNDLDTALFREKQASEE